MPDPKLTWKANSLPSAGSNLKKKKRLRLVLLLGFLVGGILVIQLQQTSRDSWTSTTTKSYTCPFRNHSRYYGLTEDDYPPPFLRSAFYIHGKPPMILSAQQPPSKVCFKTQLQAIMDGTNPTIVSLERLFRELSPESLEPWRSIVKVFPTAAYLVSNTFKSTHQCDYNRTQIKQARENKKRLNQVHKDDGSQQRQPSGRQNRNEVDLLLLDESFGTLWQTTIQAVGSIIGRSSGIAATTNSLPADDARLLVHDGSLFLTFKRYGARGINEPLLYLANLQAIWKEEESPALSMTVHATREWAICCGRNFMALSSTIITLQPTTTTSLGKSTASHVSSSSPSSQLSFLTWPDPIWVQSLDTSSSQPSPDNITSIQFENPNEFSRNDMGKSSNFHGTSGFLLYLPKTHEYLGVGHFHRERKWAKDVRVDAIFGHHYTHAFFTISASAPYALTRLSQEFVLGSTTNPRDADIIQFVSGIEWKTKMTRDHKQEQQKVVLVYGVNDCEGAVVVVDWATIDQMLLPVPAGSQVVHTMKNLPREAFVQAMQEQQ